MTVTHKLTMDLARPGTMPRVDMVQGDAYVRQLALSLECDGESWSIPEDAAAVICYRRADGVEGAYDTLSGEPAWSVSGNVLYLDIASSILAVAGAATLTVELIQGGSRISTFALLCCVQRAIVPEEISDGAALLGGLLRAPENAQVGQYFRAAAVDAQGRITAVEAADLEDALAQALTDAAQSGAFQGASAYEVAVANGFEGSQEEWLESLQGTLADEADLGDIQRVNVTGTFSTDYGAQVTFGGNRLQDVQTPEADTDAANKAYADETARLAAEPYLVPEQWQAAVEEAAALVWKNQDAGGRDCLSFLWFSDCHGAADSTMGHLAAALMDRCAISYALMSGDAADGEAQDEAAARQTLAAADEVFAPIGWQRLLQVQGETDGAWDGGHLSAGALYGAVFRKLAGDARRVWGGDGSYYYLDAPEARLRFIVLNSHWTAEGQTPDSGDYGYGNEQLNWLAATALDFPEEGWAAVLAAHVPPGQAYAIRDQQILEEILNAHSWSEAYSGAWGTAGDWDYVSVDWDFTGRPAAQIVGFFAGHSHQDSLDTEQQFYPLITVADSQTEPALDIVTVDRAQERVYLVRLGAQQERICGFGDALSKIYRITAHLSSCTLSSDSDLAEEWEYYQAVLTPDSGYVLTDVSVTMDGEDITQECYSDGMIAIEAVLGPVTITAIAEAE